MNFGEKNNNGLYIFIYVERDGELIMSKTKVVVTHYLSCSCPCKKRKSR